jgi:hypothetical protein
VGKETPYRSGCLLFITAILQYCSSELRTGQNAPTLAEVDLQDIEVQDVDYIVIVNVGRPYPAEPELLLDGAKVEGIDDVVGIIPTTPSVSTSLRAELLRGVPISDYQISPIERRRVRDMPAALCPPVVGSIRQGVSHREVAAGVRSEIEGLSCPTHAQLECARNRWAVSRRNSLPRQVTEDDIGA